MPPQNFNFWSIREEYPKYSLHSLNGYFIREIEIIS